jgi:transposase
MTKEQTMSQPIPAAEPGYAAFVAIDWADREHAWALQLPDSGQRETGKLAHTPEAIEAWALELATRFAGRPVAVALEQARGALLYALSKYPHLVLYPIHPSTSYDYRKAIFPSGSKDDPKDAGILLDLLTRHRDRLRVLQPDTAQTRKLQILVEQRRQLVDQRTAQTNRITGQLKLYFPQVLDWFDHLHAPIVAAFLQRWPTLPRLQAETPEAVRAFFHQHGSRSSQRIEKRLQQIQQAQAPLEDAAVIEPGVLLVQTLLDVVGALNQGIRALESAIEDVAAAHPDYFIFSSFPGAGPALAPRLLAAFGSQRERYANANEMQSFSGIAPVMEASGRQRWIHFRWACPKFLRQTLHEYAAQSLQFCDWAKSFYAEQKARGKSHHAAIRALAFKWIRILFRCWQSQQSYQDDVYVAARARRAVPLARRPLGASAGLRSAAPAVTACANPQDSGLRKAGVILKSLISMA